MNWERFMNALPFLVLAIICSFIIVLAVWLGVRVWKLEKRSGTSGMYSRQTRPHEKAVANAVLSPNEARAFLEQTVPIRYKTVHFERDLFDLKGTRGCADFHDGAKVKHFFYFDSDRTGAGTMVFVCFWCDQEYRINRRVYLGLVTGTITTPSSKEYVGRSLPTPGQSHEGDA